MRPRIVYLDPQYKCPKCGKQIGYDEYTRNFAECCDECYNKKMKASKPC